MAAAARVELIKACAQARIQVLTTAVLICPLAFCALLAHQSGTPSDALLGAWARSSGFSLPLVLLSFAGNWGAPIIAGVVAGDLFAAEDRLDTWKTILAQDRRLGQITAGKLVAAGLLSLALGLLLGAASIVGGLLFAGGAGMPDLSGQLLSGWHLLALECVAWLLALLPLLAYTAVAALVSVAADNGIVAVLAPILVALACQLLALTGNGVWLHLLLIGSSFDAWHGLLTEPVFIGPALVSLLACLGWTAACVWCSWRLLRRREFVPAASERLVGWRRLGAPLRSVVVAVLVLGALAGAATLGPAGVTAGRLDKSLAATFRHLTLYQQRLLGHPIPAGSRYEIAPLCNKRGARPVGQGDWDCPVNVYVLLPGGRQPLTDTPVDYDVSVGSNGCYKAAAPAAVVGGTTLRDTSARRVLNPLTVLYGCFDVL